MSVWHVFLLCVCVCVCVCVCISACVAAPHDRVMPAVRIKLLQVWQIKTTERKRGEREYEESSFWHHAPFFSCEKKKKERKKKVTEKQPVFSQPTLVLVTKHRIHCAMVAMVMGAIYTYEWRESPDAVGRLSWWGAGAFAALAVWETNFLTITWCITSEISGNVSQRNAAEYYLPS